MKSHQILNAFILVSVKSSHLLQPRIIFPFILWWNKTFDKIFITRITFQISTLPTNKQTNTELVHISGGNTTE